MTPEEKAVLASFIGATHGEMKQLGGMVTHPAKDIRSDTEGLKNELAKIMTSAVDQTQQDQPQHFDIQYVPKDSVPYEKQTVAVDTNQLSFDFDKAAKYSDIVEEIQKLSAKIDNLSKIVKEVLEKKKKVRGGLLNETITQES